ncbi:MAG: hemerythrin domain-containing protein [Flavitalea sp.]
MKRHEALASLSREHHNSLILAQLLKKDSPAYKGLPEDPAAKVIYASNMFRTDIQEHFRKEEAMLDMVRGWYEDIQHLALEIVMEHQALTVGFLSLSDADDPAEAMDDLGRKLELHIRKEERVLFPMIQQRCSEEMLKEIHQLLL